MKFISMKITYYAQDMNNCYYCLSFVYTHVHIDTQIHVRVGRTTLFGNVLRVPLYAREPSLAGVQGKDRES